MDSDFLYYALYIQGRMTGSHTENAYVLFNDDEITILIDNLKITALEDILVVYVSSHRFPLNLTLGP